MTIEVGDYISALLKDVRPEVRVSGVLIASSAQGYSVALLDAEGQMAIAKCFLRHVRQIARRPVDTPDRQRDGDDLSDFDEVTRDFIDRARSSLDVIGHFGWDFAAAFQALALRGAIYPEFRDALLKQGRPRKTVRVRKKDAMSLRYPGSFGSGKRR